MTDSSRQSEYRRYKSVCAAESVAIPKRPAFVRKIDDINGLVNRRWTEQELAEKLNRQNALRIKYSGVERERVQKALEEARARGDEGRAARLQEELDGMETHRLAFRTSLTPAKSSNSGTPSNKKEGPSQQERLALLNLENRRKNAEAVRQAQLKERARQREAEVRNGMRVKRVNVVNGTPGSENGGGGTPDARQSRSPNGGGRDPPMVAGSQPRASTPADQELAEKLRQLQREKENGKGIPTIHKPLMDDDIIGALDLGIDVDIEI